MSKVTSERSAQEPSNARFDFPKKAKVQPKGFNDLNIGDMVTVTVRGKLKSISMRDNYEGWGGKDFSINITSCIIGEHDDSGVNYKT